MVLHYPAERTARHGQRRSTSDGTPSEEEASEASLPLFC